MIVEILKLGSSRATYYDPTNGNPRGRVQEGDVVILLESNVDHEFGPMGGNDDVKFDVIHPTKGKLGMILSTYLSTYFFHVISR